MNATVSLNGFVLDLDRAELRGSDGKAIELRPQSMAVLIALARRRGELVTKRDLLAQVWPGVAVTDDSLVQCVVDIRRTLDDGEQRVVRTLPRRGYTLAVETPSLEPSGLVPGDAQRRLWPIRAAAAVALLLACTFAVLLWPLDRRDSGAPAAQAQPPPHTPLGANLAVLPLRSVRPGGAPSAARDHAGLDGEGLAYLISGELARNTEMRVASTLVTAALLREGLSAQQIGRKLGVSYVVDASFARDNEYLQIEAQLIDTRDDSIAWSWRYEATAQLLPRAVDALVEKVGRSLGASVRELRKADALQRPPASLDVYARVLRGIALKHQLSPSALRQARLELTDAVHADPNYAPAWLYLGWVKGIAINNRTDAELSHSHLGQAVAEVQHAIELDPTLASAWQGLSIVLVYAGRYEEAVTAAERSVALGPGDPDNWLFLGMAQHNVGLHEASLVSVEKALAWNPIRPGYYPAIHAFAAYGARRYADALQAARECHERAPAILRCKGILLSALLRLGRDDEARATWQHMSAAVPALRDWSAKTSEIDLDLDRLRGAMSAAPVNADAATRR